MLTEGVRRPRGRRRERRRRSLLEPDDHVAGADHHHDHIQPAVLRQDAFEDEVHVPRLEPRPSDVPDVHVLRPEPAPIRLLAQPPLEHGAPRCRLVEHEALDRASARDEHAEDALAIGWHRRAALPQLVDIEPCARLDLGKEGWAEMHQHATPGLPHEVPRPRADPPPRRELAADEERQDRHRDRDPGAHARRQFLSPTSRPRRST